jgi:hypothetical protein
MKTAFFLAPIAVTLLLVASASAQNRPAGNPFPAGGFKLPAGFPQE